MGEEVFTAEERVILGEYPEPQPAVQDPPAEGGTKPAEEEAKAPEGEKAPEKEPEHTDEEKAAVEKMGLKIDDKGFVIDEEGTRIPAKRWKKLYYDYKEAARTAETATAGKTEIERKYKQLKELGPEKYYGMYPEEAPAGYTPGAAKEAAAEADPLDMVAQYPDPNHPFHGKTLREIYAEDAGEGRRLERAWEQSQQKARTVADKQRETVEQARQRIKQESEAEVVSFTATMAKELFSKDAQSLSAEEQKAVEKTIQDTLDFMQRTKRGAGILADAYFLMNREKILADAQTKGGKAALESLQKNGIPSISSGAGAASTGMDAYEAMDADRLAREIDNMDEKQYLKFKKNASPALKAKFPGIAWD